VLTNEFWITNVP